MAKILIGCEESQAVTIEFRKLGHEAYSCDIQDCSGGYPEWHIKDDIFNVINDNWNLIISFVPCTDLANSGAASFEEKRNDGRQEKAICFFYEVWKKSNCVENPIGIMNGGNYIKKWFPKLYQEMKNYGFPFKPSQIIHPYYFGDAYAKSTCLWLKGLPKLIHASENNLFEQKTHVDPEYLYYNSKKTKSGKSKYSHFGKLGKGKGKERSKTPDGLAKDMANQWSEYLKFINNKWNNYEKRTLL